MTRKELPDEPVIWSHETDVLPEDHPLAYQVLDAKSELLKIKRDMDRARYEAERERRKHEHLQKNISAFTQVVSSCYAGQIRGTLEAIIEAEELKRRMK